MILFTPTLAEVICRLQQILSGYVQVVSHFLTLQIPLTWDVHVVISEYFKDASLLPPRHLEQFLE
jgi:hypothetical protein